MRRFTREGRWAVGTLFAGAGTLFSCIIFAYIFSWVPSGKKHEEFATNLGETAALTALVGIILLIGGAIWTTILNDGHNLKERDRDRY